MGNSKSSGTSFRFKLKSPPSYMGSTTLKMHLLERGQKNDGEAKVTLIVILGVIGNHPPLH